MRCCSHSLNAYSLCSQHELSFERYSVCISHCYCFRFRNWRNISLKNSSISWINTCHGLTILCVSFFLLSVFCCWKLSLLQPIEHLDKFVSMAVMEFFFILQCNSCISRISIWNILTQNFMFWCMQLLANRKEKHFIEVYINIMRRWGCFWFRSFMIEFFSLVDNCIIRLKKKIK